MEKKLTVLQELISDINIKIGHLTTLLLEAEREGRKQESLRLTGKIEGYKNCKQDAEFYLEFEKEQIEVAYILGKVNSDGVYDVTPDDYYTKTYGK